MALQAYQQHQIRCPGEIKGLTLCLGLRAETMVAREACASLESRGGVMMTTPLERPRISPSSCMPSIAQSASWHAFNCCLKMGMFVSRPARTSECITLIKIGERPLSYLCAHTQNPVEHGMQWPFCEQISDTSWASAR